MRAACLVVLGLIVAGCGDLSTKEHDSSPETAIGSDDVARLPENAPRQTAESPTSSDARWVQTDQSSQRSSPGGLVVNRVYYGQRVTIHERRGDWVRVTRDGLDARWMPAADLARNRPPEKPAYEGSAEYRDARIAPDAIANPGEYGLTRADIDIIRKGAKWVLQSRSDCARIEDSDKSGSRANTYFVTCRSGSGTHNVFFTRSEVEALNIR